MPKAQSPRPTVLVLVAAGVALLVAGAVAMYFGTGRRDAGPAPGSADYQQLVRAFYRGLASLDTGILDNAKTEFTRATRLAPREGATWANLGVTHLRLSEFDAAAEAINEAAARAPRSSAIAMIQGALDAARGRLDAAIGDFERAVALDPRSIRARFALADALERGRGNTADAQAQQLLDEILEIQPGNLAVLVERARLAARRADTASLDDSVRVLADRSSGWPPAAGEQLAALRSAAVARDYQSAGRALAFLRNVLARVPAFRDSLAAASVPAERLAEAVDRFIDLPPPSSMPSPPDLTIAFSREPFDARTFTAATVMAAWPLDERGAVGVFAADGQTLRRIDGAQGAWPFPRNPGAPPSGHILPLDWNHDFRTDLLLTGSGGLRLLIQNGDGTLADATRTASTDAAARSSSFAAWAADVEMDGDLDVVVGLTKGDPLVLRNNGDGTWRTLRPFAGVDGARAFAWGDIDADGDPDAVFVDAAGRLHLFTNQQAGVFERREAPRTREGVVALALGDTNADGTLEILTLDTGGVVRSAVSTEGGWDEQPIATWRGLPPGAEAGTYRLTLADLDNNGALDLIAAGPSGSQVWLSDERTAFQPIAALAGVEVFGALDLNADGRLDLIALSGGQPIRMLGGGQQNYHWQVIRPRAQTSAGDQRVNSFGVGGEIEVRSGLLVQKQVLDGSPIHVGLGSRTGVDLARIVWPNGVMQVEFDLRVDQTVVAEQRLKGSCPWLFAYDGHDIGFVTDILWRSPLGLRINAQDTAGSTQTEDRVKVRGDQLVPRDGIYDLRITAELWESHFFDHVSLMVVDHPAGQEVFVDERFSRQPPSLVLHATTPPRPVTRAWDDHGQEVTGLVRAQDGRHAAGFEKGPYQGVTREHYLEFELGEETLDQPALWLIAHGWVYPTDSSINVAIAQGRHPVPHGLALEAQDATGAWRVVAPDLGFPAGKNKTMLIDVSARPRGTRRMRLRTNMEVYWDSLAYAQPVPDTSLRTIRLAPASAELRYRGFSRTSEDAAAHAPEVARYGDLANTVPRWRDLVGYHTRFGEVKELLGAVDDRYVIMNAGDELRLSFPAQPPPATGWTRDFIFISDGWEKDGDFNTGYSKTVQPLPLHDRPDYVSTAASPELEDDPAYQRHPEDWQRYHTRFVSPEWYLRGLRSH